MKSDFSSENHFNPLTRSRGCPLTRKKICYTKLTSLEIKLNLKVNFNLNAVLIHAQSSIDYTKPFLLPEHVSQQSPTVQTVQFGEQCEYVPLTQMNLEPQSSYGVLCCEKMKVDCIIIIVARY